MSKTKSAKQNRSSQRNIFISAVVYVSMFILLTLAIKWIFPSYDASGTVSQNQISSGGSTYIGVCVPDKSGNIPSDCSQTKYSWGEYVLGIYTFAIRLGGILAAIMIIYAAYIYLTSQGDTSKINQAKEIILGAILGFVLLMIVGLIAKYLGTPDLGTGTNIKN